MLACPLAYHITHPLTFLIDPTRPISQFPPAFFSSQFDSLENPDLFSPSPLSHYVILLSSLSLHKKPISHTNPIPNRSEFQFPPNKKKKGKIMHSSHPLQQSNPSTRQRDQRIPGRKRHRIQNRSPQEGDHAFA